MFTYIALALLVAAVAADYFTTRGALKRGGIEANPIIGDKTPSNKRLLLFSIIPLAVILAAAGWGIYAGIPPAAWHGPFYLALAIFRGFFAFRNTKVGRKKSK